MQLYMGIIVKQFLLLPHRSNASMNSILRLFPLNMVLPMNNLKKVGN